MFTPVLCCFIIIYTLQQLVFTSPIESEDVIDVIDLSHLGARLYGKPDYNFGKEFNTININDNPEEKGPYLEGDLLMLQNLSRNGMKNEVLRWKGGEIPYIIRGKFNTNEMNVIQNAFNQYHRQTCIKFIPRRPSHSDYIVIENAQSGCWSSVGRISGEQKVNLQSPGCVTKTGTVVHELLHVLGFLHEQNREDRDKFVKIIEGNIRNGYEVNFKKAESGETSSFGVAYDYGSVLHYSANAFSKNGNPTIEARMKTSEKMGQREGFSKKDIEKVNKMYKCQKTTAEEDPDIMTSTIGPPSQSPSIFGNILEILFPTSSMDEEEMIDV
ncbi:hypothetical protein PVAND_011630 [Polypedilum vanderplanki]|uniref:Metalloendopeptidase n=1 Tax=Polypedilum vanderplanki TaxID=319348 RepID=A0A9J6CJ66_POLVA|nr:hypothetical protein PVAND_011630 [Polypedilum vanderplanki]